MDGPARAGAAAPRAVRRLDYRPPDYLVDTVELRFELDPSATFVTAALAFRRNPAAATADEVPPPLVLDGEEQYDVAFTARRRRRCPPARTRWGRPR